MVINGVKSVILPNEVFNETKDSRRHRPVAEIERATPSRQRRRGRRGVEKWRGVAAVIRHLLVVAKVEHADADVYRRWRRRRRRRRHHRKCLGEDQLIDGHGVVSHFPVH